MINNVIAVIKSGAYESRVAARSVAAQPANQRGVLITDNKTEKKDRYSAPSEAVAGVAR